MQIMMMKVNGSILRLDKSIFSLYQLGSKKKIGGSLQMFLSSYFDGLL